MKYVLIKSHLNINIIDTVTAQLLPHTNLGMKQTAICFLFPQTCIKYLQLCDFSEELQETLSSLHNIQHLPVVCSIVVVNNCPKKSLI
jgi:hypothetical protein